MDRIITMEDENYSLLYIFAYWSFYLGNNDALSTINQLHNKYISSFQTQLKSESNPYYVGKGKPDMSESPGALGDIKIWQTKTC